VLLNFLVFCVVFFVLFVFALCLILRGLVFCLSIYFSVLELTSIWVLFVLLIFLVFCVVLCFCALCCVCLRRMSCVQCFPCLWIVLFFISPSVFSDAYFIWYMFDLILTSSYANKVSHVMYVLDVLVPCRSNKLFYYVGDSIITKKRVDIPLTDLIRTRFCTACSKPGPVFTCL